MVAKVIQANFMSGRFRPTIPAVAGRGGGALQRSGVGNVFQVDPQALGLVSGGGRPLPQGVQAKMEAAMGADFSAVRIHVGPQAERIGAIAFTLGNDIYFAPGRFQPDTAHGQFLLGHELAHVVQQSRGRVRNPMGGGLAIVQDPALEVEADRMAQRVAMQPAAVRSTPGSVPGQAAAQAKPKPGTAPIQRSNGAPPPRWSAPSFSSPTISRGVFAPPKTCFVPTAGGAAGRALQLKMMMSGSPRRWARGVLQAKLNKFEGKKELNRLLNNSQIQLDYDEKKKLEDIAEIIGQREDAAPENITQLLLSNEQIHEVFFRSRTSVDESAWGKPKKPLEDLEEKIFRILKDMAFFAGTKKPYLDSIRKFGLQPREGGKVGGGSDVNSVSAKRDKHMTGSKGKVFVTRDYKEAKGYAEESTVPVIVFVPPEKRDILKVDPDSRKGLYSEQPLNMADQEAGLFGAGLIGSIQNELRKRYPDDDVPSTEVIRRIYLKLIDKGLLPNRMEAYTESAKELSELLRYWQPILNRLTDITINGGINGAAAMIIAELRDSDVEDQLTLLRRIRPIMNKDGEVVGIARYLRGG